MFERIRTIYRRYGRYMYTRLANIPPRGRSRLIKRRVNDCRRRARNSFYRWKFQHRGFHSAPRISRLDFHPFTRARRRPVFSVAPVITLLRSRGMQVSPTASTLKYCIYACMHFRLISDLTNIMMDAVFN